MGAASHRRGGTFDIGDHVVVVPPPSSRSLRSSLSSRSPRSLRSPPPPPSAFTPRRGRGGRPPSRQRDPPPPDRTLRSVPLGGETAAGERGSRRSGRGRWTRERDRRQSGRSGGVAGGGGIGGGGGGHRRAGAAAEGYGRGREVMDTVGGAGGAAAGGMSWGDGFANTSPRGGSGAPLSPHVGQRDTGTGGAPLRG